jgi:hypothetical protein
MAYSPLHPVVVLVHLASAPLHMFYQNDQAHVTPDKKITSKLGWLHVLI